jgi:hypothetical protein
MQLTSADDLDDVVDTYITGIAAVEEIAPGVVRVSYFTERRHCDWEEGDARGLRRKVVDHQIWSLPQLAGNLLAMQQVLKEMNGAPARRQFVQEAAVH